MQRDYVDDGFCRVGVCVKDVEVKKEGCYGVVVVTKVTGWRSLNNRGGGEFKAGVKHDESIYSENRSEQACCAIVNVSSFVS